MGELLIIAFAIVLVGMLVVLPIVAVLSEHRQHLARINAEKDKDKGALASTVKTLEAQIVAQQEQICELKELLEVNILKMDDVSGLQQRVGETKKD